MKRGREPEGKKKGLEGCQRKRRNFFIIKSKQKYVNYVKICQQQANKNMKKVS